MPGADALDHRAAIAKRRQRAQQPPVVAQRDLEQGHRRRRAHSRRHHRRARDTGEKPRGALRDNPQRPGQRRDEGRGQRGVGLAHMARGVNLVIQNHQRAEAARLRRRRHRHRRQQVGGTIRAGRRRAAHGAGHHHRPVARRQQIEREGCLLDGVGALDHHGAVEALRESRRNLARHVDHVRQRQRGAGQAQRRARLDIGHRRQLGHGGDQIARVQRRRDAPCRSGRHGDGAAQRQDQDARAHQNGICSESEPNCVQPLRVSNSGARKTWL